MRLKTLKELAEEVGINNIIFLSKDMTLGGGGYNDYYYIDSDLAPFLGFKLNEINYSNTIPNFLLTDDNIKNPHE